MVLFIFHEEERASSLVVIASLSGRTPGNVFPVPHVDLQFVGGLHAQVIDFLVAQPEFAADRTEPVLVVIPSTIKVHFAVASLLYKGPCFIGFKLTLDSEWVRRIIRLNQIDPVLTSAAILVNVIAVCERNK